MLIHSIIIDLWPSWMSGYNRDSVKAAIRESVGKIYQAEIGFDPEKLYSNTLDCFSAVLDAIVQGETIDNWLVQERQRQQQKTKQNAVGTLHEEIIGSMHGAQRLEVGKVYDAYFPSLKLIAEIKNKFNTTKGNHKTQIYRDLAFALEKLPGFTAYYVEILPKNGKRYNVPFVPSDNLSGNRMPAREDIRKIDGKTFYERVTGESEAMDNIYSMLPRVVSEILAEDFQYHVDGERIATDPKFKEIYNKIYPNSL
jgi:Eco47II restriction endonuclease